MAPLVGLTIAGFDPSGGAGVLADVKTMAAHGLYAEACITLLTVQSTQGVAESELVTPVIVSRTLTTLALDNSIRVIKLGAIGSAEMVAVVCDFLISRPDVPVVLDPVVRSSSGAELLDADGLAILRDRLLPLATWVTPNWAELAQLTGAAVNSPTEVERAALMLKIAYPKIYFLITGGDQNRPDDYLLTPESPKGAWVEGVRIETRATHGTGCTLSSALASRLALYPLEPPLDRVAACKRYVEGAMRHAPGIGRGPGPLDHFWQR